MIIVKGSTDLNLKRFYSEYKKELTVPKQSYTGTVLEDFEYDYNIGDTINIYGIDGSALSFISVRVIDIDGDDIITEVI